MKRGKCTATSFTPVLHTSKKLLQVDWGHSLIPAPEGLHAREVAKRKSHTIEGPPKTRYKNVLMVWLGMLCLYQVVGGKFVFVTFTSPESNFAVNWSNRSWTSWLPPIDL